MQPDDGLIRICNTYLKRPWGHRPFNSLEKTSINLLSIRSPLKVCREKNTNSANLPWTDKSQAQAKKES